MKSCKGIILFILFFCLFCFSIANAQINKIDSPVITDVHMGAANEKPTIRGTAPSGSFVHIYVDGVYNGKTDALSSHAITAEFNYESFIYLNSGDHTAWAIAEDEMGSKSKLSNIFEFNIASGVPAPTLFYPATNKDNVSQPFIVGLSKNDLNLFIYIDGRLDGELKIENHESGTASFSYQVLKKLNRGYHVVYVIAKDKQGKKSKKSNIVSFKVAEPSIANGANEEDYRQGLTDEELNKLLGVSVGDENEDSKSKWSPSLIIFILFFIGIISCIFWVNYELRREKISAQDELFPQQKKWRE